MKRFLLILVLIALPASLTIAQENKDRYLSAVEQFNAGNYSDAADSWLGLFNAGYDNYEILYNLGNAYYKMNDIPMAILFYERALLRKPGNEDIKYNLAIASGHIKDRFESIPGVFLVRWFNYISLTLLYDSWAVISIVSFIIALGLILLFLFLSRYNLKILSFWVGLLFLIVSVFSLSFSYRSRDLVYSSNEAIVVSPVVTGRSTPGESGTELFVIHEGLKVRTGEKLGEWIEIRLPDGNKGWVTTSSIEII